jgi:hypothetical protein
MADDAPHHLGSVSYILSYFGVIMSPAMLQAHNR